MRGFKTILILPSFHLVLLNSLSIITCYHLTGDTLGDQKDYAIVVSWLLIFSTPSFVVWFINLSKINNSNINFRISIGVKLIRRLVLIIFLSNMLFLLICDFDRIWLNTNYLEMIDSKKIVNDNFYLKIYLRGLIFFGLISTFLLVKIKWTIKNSILLIAGTFNFLFIYIYLFGNNSRSAALLLLTLSLLLAISSVKYWKLKFFFTIVLLYLCVLTYNSVLIGRGSGKQGISTISRNISTSISSNMEYVISSTFLAENLLGGAYIFYLGKNQNVKYPTKYKILSFSPFPSLIDNFDKWRKYNTVIKPFVPASTYLEVYRFGLFYILLFYSIIIVCLTYIDRLILNNFYIGLIVAMPAYLYFISAQQYPVRNFLRFLFISAILSFLLNRYFKIKKSKNKPAP